MKKIFTFFPPILFIIFLLILWESIVDLFRINPFLLPAPSAIVVAYWGNASLLVPHILQTLIETLLGLFIGILLGVSIAILLRFSSLLRKMIYPLLILSQTIPLIALAPLLLIWFGFTILPKVIIVALVCFFPITVAFSDGMEKISPQIISLLRSMGASRIQILYLAELPGALPSFFSGLRIAVAYSVTGAIVGEYVGGYQGLGIFMQNAAHSYAVTLVFVVIIITSLMSVILFGMVSLLEYLCIPWRREKGSKSLR